ncbi:MAG: SPOR domain-containing protein, partial [Marinicella sp.]
MDQELKQRLIGAAVIIALAVIFVPMLFDGEVEQKNNQNISINIPDVDENSLEVKKFDIDTPVVGTSNMPAGDVELVVNDQKPQLIDKNDSNPIQMDPAENLVPETQTQSAVAETKPEEIKTKPPLEIPADKPIEVVSKPVSQPVNKPVEIKKPDLSSPLNQVYRVKLGSFSQQGNAEKVKSSLLQKNIKAIVEYNPGLKLYRVWSQDLYQDESKANAYVSAVNQQNLNIPIRTLETYFLAMTAGVIGILLAQAMKHF